MFSQSRPTLVRGLFALAGSMVMMTAAALAGGASYSSTFDAFPAEGWSDPRWETAPTGQKFLGPYDNETTTLTISNLQDHTHVVIAVDVYIIGGWAGNEGELPSELSVTLDEDEQIFVATFSNAEPGHGATQSYPDGDLRAAHPARHGAFNTNTLGYLDRAGADLPDSTYRLVLSAKHSGPIANLKFRGSGLDPKTGARWALDNVSVYTYAMANAPSADVFGRTEALTDGFGGNTSGGSLGFNPPSGRGGIPGGPPPSMPGGPPEDPPPPNPNDNPVIPSPGGATVGALALWWVSRRRRG